MIIRAPNVLTPDELRKIHGELRSAPFVDGTTTTGWSARGVKKNQQVDVGSENHARLQDLVRTAFLRSSMLQAATLPFSLTQVLFNRYENGMEYGPHVDAPVMSWSGASVRTDVAITVFLSDPKTYAGGELVVDENGVKYAFKADAGAAIAYPADTLHHVSPVTQGARYAAIIWVQSQVREATKRKVLWDLNNAQDRIFDRDGKSATFDAVSRSHANLLRMWADV